MAGSATILRPARLRHWNNLFDFNVGNPRAPKLYLAATTGQPLGGPPAHVAIAPPRPDPGPRPTPTPTATPTPTPTTTTSPPAETPTPTVPVATTSPQPAVTPAPTAPAATPAPKLERVLVTLAFFLDKSRFNTFAVKEVPAGSTVTATCPKGCARKTFTKRNARGTVSLKALVASKRIKTGTTITVTVSRPGAIAAVKIFKMRGGGRQPQVTTRCLPPGQRKPVIC